MTPLIIKDNYMRTFSLLILCALFTLLGYFIFVGSVEPSTDVIFAKLIGISSMVFFGGGGLLILYVKIKNKFKVLTVDQNGLYGSFTLFSSKYIPWSNIDKIYLKTTNLIISKEHFIIIEIKDINVYISTLSATGKKFPRLTFKRNKNGTSTISIPLDFNPKERELIINRINDFSTQQKKKKRS